MKHLVMLLITLYKLCDVFDIEIWGKKNILLHAK